MKLCTDVRLGEERFIVRGFAFWILFNFLMFIFEREREREREWMGEGQKERETQNRKQAPGSEL